MDLQLKDKIALVSGSTAGIGYAIAASLAKEGATVIVNGRSQKRVESAIALIEKEGSSGKLLGLVADLGTAEGVNLAVQKHPHKAIRFS
jgi:NAD(P)-dependent dehydrogenase (short-subunit alcohol dehydrogenase family)